MKNNSTLIKNLLSDYRINAFFQNISLMLIGSLILAFSSKVQVPFWPVPMTMQTFAVFIIGMTYGSKLAFFTLLLYLFEGAIGLPVFAKGGGLLYLTGPTAGYLYGMTIAAGVIGYLAERNFNDSYFKSLISSLFFNSNFFFWKASPYFESTADTQLLLHTWSLSIEEQF